MALNFALLDLVNDDRGTHALGFHASLFAFLEDLEFLEAFNFHHEVKAFLLIDPLLLEDLVFLELFVADSDNL